jgi:hypothetical protein
MFSALFEGIEKVMMCYQYYSNPKRLDLRSYEDQMLKDKLVKKFITQIRSIIVHNNIGGIYSRHSKILEFTQKTD